MARRGNTEILVLVLSMACPLAGSWWESQMAVASATRWFAAIYLVVGTVLLFVWQRFRGAERIRLATADTHSTVAESGKAGRLLLFFGRNAGCSRRVVRHRGGVFATADLRAVARFVVWTIGRGCFLCGPPGTRCLGIDSACDMAAVCGVRPGGRNRQPGERDNCVLTEPGRSEFVLGHASLDQLAADQRDRGRHVRDIVDRRHSLVRWRRGALLPLDGALAFQLAIPAFLNVWLLATAWLRSVDGPFSSPELLAVGDVRGWCAGLLTAAALALAFRFRGGPMIAGNRPQVAQKFVLASR